MTPWPTSKYLWIGAGVAVPLAVILLYVSIRKAQDQAAAGAGALVGEGGKNLPATLGNIGSGVGKAVGGAVIGVVGEIFGAGKDAAVDAYGSVTTWIGGLFGTDNAETNLAGG